MYVYIIGELCDGSPIKIQESMVLVLTYAVCHKLQAITDLLTVHNQIISVKVFGFFRNSLQLSVTISAHCAKILSQALKLWIVKHVLLTCKEEKRDTLLLWH